MLSDGDVVETCIGVRMFAAGLGYVREVHG